MKRLLVGFAALCLVTVTAGLTGSTSIASAGVPGFTTVRAANAYSFAGGHPFDGTFCVDGVDVAEPATEEVAGPLTLASGSVSVDFYNSIVADCDTGTPTASATVVLPDQGTVTLMAYWPSTGPAVVMLTDPLDCVDPGTGRLTVRNGADSKGGAVDIYGEIDGVSTLLLSDVASGTQGTVDLPVGDYTNVYASETGTLNLVTPMDDISIVANSGAYAYLYGGDDGAPGAFTANPAELNACEVTTTIAPTTTAPPAAAAAVQATPAFTG